MGFFQKPGGAEWLVVFLGNPGPRYAGTRHNVGFMAADACEKDTGAHLLKARFRALTALTKLAGAGVLLMKPQTFKTLSGDAVIQAVRYYRLPPERVVVVSDDVSLPLSKLRIRRGGSAGGHNGLKSIIDRLGTDAFPRVKVGVGAPPHPDYDMADWVLGSFKNQDAEDIAAAAQRAWEAAKCYITEGPERAMNRYN